MREGRDALAEVSRLGVVLGWARTMPDAAVWFPEDRILLLNASEPRARLCSAVERMLPTLRREARADRDDLPA